MLFGYFVLPVLFALAISVAYVWRAAYKQPKAYHWLFRIVYGLVIAGGAVAAATRLSGALALGWTFAEPWFLAAALGWLIIIGLAAWDWVKPISSRYMTYLVPAGTWFVAGLCSVKPDVWGTLWALLAFGLLAAWVAVLNVVTSRSRGLARVAMVAGLMVVPPTATTGWLVYTQQQSVLPAAFSMNMHGTVGMHHHHTSAVSVADLRGPQTAPRVAKFSLEAAPTTITLASGATSTAWVYRTADAASMPVLRVKQGDLVEATLKNSLPAPVTIHWHGVDVPNGEDGVAGVTQDAVKPGETFVYRFIAEDAGTYWFHSHQDSNEQVKKGLLGALIVEPREGALPSTDIPVLLHEWKIEPNQEQPALGLHDDTERRTVAAGEPVRLRLINTDNDPESFQLTGVPYRIVAMDGADVVSGQEITDQTLVVPSGGRIDVGFVMPANAVQLAYDGQIKRSQAAIVMSPDGQATFTPRKTGLTTFDAAAYGQPRTDAIAPDAAFDKTYDLKLDDSVRFFNGSLQFTFPINDRLMPDTPMMMVREGDVVKVSFKNRSTDTHPMHLHGHHFTVLSHNGQESPGRPVLDTVNVAPGESWTIAFTADNPGMWMSHCHNLWHASTGMDLMVAYDTVMTPFEIRPGDGNKPE